MKYYLYAGYYELFITSAPLNKPYMLVSWHKTPENAEYAAEKFDPDACLIFEETALPEYHEANIMDWLENNEVHYVKIQGRRFIVNGPSEE